MLRNLLSPMLLQPDQLSLFRFSRNCFSPRTWFHCSVTCMTPLVIRLMTPKHCSSVASHVSVICKLAVNMCQYKALYSAVFFSWSLDFFFFFSCRIERVRWISDLFQVGITRVEYSHAKYDNSEFGFSILNISACWFPSFWFVIVHKSLNVFFW